MHVRRVWPVAATVVALALVAIVAVPALAAFSTPVPHAGVFDPSAREWLYEKAIDDVVPVASLTKLTTALTVIRLHIDLDTPVVITEEDWVGAGRTRLRVDDKVPVRTLLKLALVCSDNCAARALVHPTGLTTEAFAFRMEETAARLGCKKSSYVEPTGLDERNVSTAREVVTLFMAAMQDPLLREFLGTSEFELTPREARAPSSTPRGCCARATTSRRPRPATSTSPATAWCSRSPILTATSSPWSSAGTRRVRAARSPHASSTSPASCAGGGCSRMDRLPRLRPLEVLQVPEENGTSFVLRDPEGYTDEELVLSEAALFVAAHCDGEHGLAELQQAFHRRYGADANPEAIQSLVDRLDQAGMMETEAFAAHRESMHEAFRLSPSRAPAHAGVSYPKDEAEALAAVGGFRERRGHAGGGGAAAAGPASRVGGAAHRPARGRSVYRARLSGARRGARGGDRDRARHLARLPQTGVDRDGEAVRHPAGPGAGGRRSVPQARGLGREPPPKTSSSIARSTRSSFRRSSWPRCAVAGVRSAIVPVLSGSMRDHVPEGDPFLAALRDLLQERGERAIVVAAADLAHVGPRFGDPGVLSAEGLSFLEGEDRRSLQFVAEGDAAGFYASVMEDNDPRRICGLSPIYGLMSASAGGARQGAALRTDDRRHRHGELRKHGGMGMKTILVALLIVAAPALLAAPSGAADFTGHWEGAIQIPGMDPGLT